MLLRSLRTCRVSNLLIWTCVASCDAFCIFEKLYVETFCILPWFMHCQQGGEVCACFGHLGVFGRCSNWFGKILSSLVQAGLLGRSNRPQAVSWCAGGLTALWRRSNRPGLSEQIFALCYIPVLHCCIGSGGVCFGSGGACICAGGAICGVWALVRWFALFVWAGFVSDVSSRCPCLRGPRLVFF
jgi:hypothetical protein